jgi:hypothetical protein
MIFGHLVRRDIAHQELVLDVDLVPRLVPIGTIGKGREYYPLCVLVPDGSEVPIYEVYRISQCL